MTLIDPKVLASIDEANAEKDAQRKRELELLETIAQRMELVVTKLSGIEAGIKSLAANASASGRQSSYRP